MYKVMFYCLLLLQITQASADTKAAIATAHPLATEVGEAVLRSGGNAFDVAVAVTAMLAVVEPYGSGLGGGGFWLLSDQRSKRQIMVDGRERAPANIRPAHFLDPQGRLIREKSIDSPLGSGIPGIPAGIVYINDRYGTLPLAELLAPAIHYARHGFPVSKRYQLFANYRLNALAAHADSAYIFLRDAKVPPLGELIIQTDLAATLERLATAGKAGFYTGVTAKRLVAAVLHHGGVWQEMDLQNYHIRLREPISIDYHGINVVSAPPPSSGGIVLAQALKILEQFDLNSLSSLHKKHVVIEAMRLAYRDRAVYLGDPDYVDIPVARLLDEDYLQGLAMTIHLDKAGKSMPLIDAPNQRALGTQTTHFSVRDGIGNKVAATLSINLPFGTGIVATGTGILLNNELDDFALQMAAPNSYGLVGSDANAVAPGKRPLSSMTPTFLETDEKVAILGTPGGSRIISMVLLATLDFAAGNLPGDWVNVRRYHHQYLPDIVQFEPQALTPVEQLGLQSLGHKLSERSRSYGNMQAILWWKTRDLLFAASDPRGEGSSRIISLD